MAWRKEVSLLLKEAQSPGPRSRGTVSRLGVVFVTILALPSGLAAEPFAVRIAGEPQQAGGFDGESGTLSQVVFQFEDGAIGLAVDSKNRILVGDTANHRIRRIDLVRQTVETVAGSGPTGPNSGGFGGDGGPAVAALLNQPQGLAVDSHDNIYVADTANMRIRRVDAATGRIDSIAGSGSTTIGGFDGDEGPALKAQLNNPVGIVVDAADNVFFADLSNNRVRKIDAATGRIHTIAGGGLLGSLGSFGGDGGPAAQALLNNPASLALDARGNLYIADLGNRLVRRVDLATGLISTVAGGRDFFLLDGKVPATSARAGIGYPQAIAVDRASNLYVASGERFIYRAEAASGLLSIFSGNLFCPFSEGDAGPAVAACWIHADGMALDKNGDLLIADGVSNQVRAIRMHGPEVRTVSTDTVSNSTSTELVISGQGLSQTTSVALIPYLVGKPLSPTYLEALAVLDDGHLSATIPSGLATGVYSVAVASGLGTDARVLQNVLLHVQSPSATARPPVAAILDIGRFITEPFTFDGSPSFDPDAGEHVSYHWTLATTVPGAPPLDPTTASFRYRTTRGHYLFRLTVTDSRGLTSTVTKAVDIPDLAPFAFVDSSFPETGQPVDGTLAFTLPDTRGRVPASLTTDTLVLDGRQSIDYDGDPLQYAWTLESKPPSSRATTGTALLEPAASSTRLRLSTDRDATGALRDAGHYVVRLTVKDPGGQTATFNLGLTVGSPDNLAPAADAGLDQAPRITVLRASPLELAADIPVPLVPPPDNRRNFVGLDGRRSIDPNVPALPLSYAWRLLEAPAASLVTTLSAPASPVPTFAPDQPGLYRFGLAVSNPLFQSTLSQVKVLVSIAGQPPAPSAAITVRDGAGLPRTSPASPVSTFVAGSETIVLDGTRTADVDLQARATLTYRWGQLSGMPVELSPSTTAALVQFMAPGPGLYSFELVAQTASGLRGAPARVTIRAIAPGASRAVLAIESSASTTSATGGALAEGNQPPKVPSLRALLPTTVTLRATRLDAAGGPARGPELSSFIWRQLSGPTVALEASSSRPTSSPISTARFRPSTSGVHVFECELVSTAPDTRQILDVVTARVGVIVDSPDNHTPIARLAVSSSAPAAGGGVPPGATISLDGTGSSKTGPATSGHLLYRWVQVEGPPVLLSEPFSVVTTFVAPDFRDGIARHYAFQLFADNSVLRSEPSRGDLDIVPQTAVCSATVELLPRQAIVGLPSDITTGGRFVTAADLLDRTAGKLAARLVPGPDLRGRFELYVRGGAMQPFPLEAGRAYLVIRDASHLTTPLVGLRWPDTSLTLHLHPGLNAVSYPQPPPAGETLEDLRRRTGSTFVGYVAPDSTGTGRFRLHLPGITTPALVRSGAGYFVSSPASVVISLPGSSQGCD